MEERCKSKYALLVEEKGKLVKVLEEREKQLEREELVQKYDKEERFRQEVQQQERKLGEEIFIAELKMTEKKLEMEKATKATHAKLPELNITPFKGTAADWIRLENMFVSQVDRRLISDEEKFGYLFEMASYKVRDKISKPKRTSEGYKTAWERLKSEYGKTKIVFNAHMEDIINLSTVKGVNYEKVQMLYDQLKKSFDALQTLGESHLLNVKKTSSSQTWPYRSG